MSKTCPFFFTLLILCACGDNRETASPAREGITESVYASGVLVSKDQYQVFATVNGILQKIFIAEGDTVKKGDPLFTVLNETSRLSRENAQLAAQLADISSNQAKLDELLLNIDLLRSKMINDSLQWSRLRDLWSQNIGTKVEVEQAELSYKNSRTSYESARLRYRDEKHRLEILSQQARKNVQISRELESDFIINSVMAGKVYAIYKKEGEIVSIQTPLAVIGDPDEFILELQVDEYDITSIKPGQQIRVTMDSYKGEVFDARVTKVNPMINARTKTALVEAEFTNPPPSIYPNLTLEANIILQIKENALTLPRKFILEDRYVVLENGDTTAITIGLKDYVKAEILSGIDENDVVVLPE